MSLKFESYMIKNDYMINIINYLVPYVIGLAC